MDAELIKRLCGDAFELGAERLVDFLFDAAGSLPGSGDLRSAPALELPIIGGIRFFAGQEPIELRQRVFNALCAAEQFRKTAPHWAPPLPLREEAIEDLVNRDNVRLNLVGLFGRSLDYALWGPRHPPFAVFVSGLMAYEKTPDEIRNDVTLRREFPPCPLEGLCDRLAWRAPVT